MWHDGKHERRDIQRERNYTSGKEENGEVDERNEIRRYKKTGRGSRKSGMKRQRWRKVDQEIYRKQKRQEDTSRENLEIIDRKRR